jgi:hypothetical protein
VPLQVGACSHCVEVPDNRQPTGPACVQLPHYMHNRISDSCISYVRHCHHFVFYTNRHCSSSEKGNGIRRTFNAHPLNTLRLLTGELVVTAPTPLLSLVPGSETRENRAARTSTTGPFKITSSHTTIKNHSSPKAFEKCH